MNCDDFRHQLLVDPNCKDAEFVHHAANCPDCAPEARRALAFEAKLHTALAAETRRHRIPTAKPVEFSAHRAQGRRIIAWAIVGTLILGLGFNLWSGGGIDRGLGPIVVTASTAGTPLATAILDHIDSEPAALAAEHPVPEPTLALLLVSTGITIAPRALGPELRPVRYAARCSLRHRDVIHLVLTGETGPVTLLLMPNEPVARAERIRSGRLEGLIVPAGRGSLAIVGEPEETVTWIARRIQGEILW
jgi:hypothetical protein